MRPIVFAGPSIFGIDRSRFDLEFRPPARCGDIISAVGSGPDVIIGLIDGYFEGVRSVWHKEILVALAAGVQVVGAASMGALRAAECREFGMLGIGRIFEDYASGGRVEDADVALLHAPPELGYEPLTVAMVDVEATVAQLTATGELSSVRGASLLASARALHYKHRTWLRVLEEAGGVDETVLSVLQAANVSQKRSDALMLLEELARGASHAVNPKLDWTPQLSSTTYLRDLQYELSSHP